MARSPPSWRATSPSTSAYTTRTPATPPCGTTSSATSTNAPFNPIDKRTIAWLRPSKGAGVAAEKVKYADFRVAKGAPQVVLGMANNYADIRKEMEARILEHAPRSYRALEIAIAQGSGLPAEGGAAAPASWEFVDLIPPFDSPHHNTSSTIAQALALGMGVKMVTGDQLPIGVETARQLGMGTNMYTTDVMKVYTTRRWRRPGGGRPHPGRPHRAGGRLCGGEP
mmetsp:Transcript_555/g.1441  ORF Transcript_555/g.1441 Transcript_555/m.1441 type:complete len:225 (-) Transcript_555:658-1332(-)